MLSVPGMPWSWCWHRGGVRSWHERRESRWLGRRDGVVLRLRPADLPELPRASGNSTGGARKDDPGEAELSIGCFTPVVTLDTECGLVPAITIQVAIDNSHTGAADVNFLTGAMKLLR